MNGTKGVEPPDLLNYNYIIIPLPSGFVSAYLHVEGVQECLTCQLELSYKELGFLHSSSGFVNKTPNKFNHAESHIHPLP
jgi:hypothetical protein